MKHFINSELLKALSEIDGHLVGIKNFKNGSDLQNLILLDYLMSSKILNKIQKINQLLLKSKHYDIHNKLSFRELEIIQYICSGKTTDEIAQELNLSRHTVESHRTNLFSKLDIKNSMELVALAFRTGMVV